MVIATEADVLLEELAADPDGAGGRAGSVAARVLADWFEDDGEPEKAECLRWAVRERRMPFRTRLFPAGAVAILDRGNYFCWQDSSRSWNPSDETSVLPYEVYVRTARSALDDALGEAECVVMSHAARRYASRLEAWECLLSAWRSARLGGWVPDE